MTALDLCITSDGHPPTLGDIVRIQAQTRPDLVAMVFEGRETSCRELERPSFGIANALRAAGLAGGDRVAIPAKDSHRFFELLLGATIVGVVSGPTNRRLFTPKLKEAASDRAPAE